jgi:hypothetical protein
MRANRTDPRIPNSLEALVSHLHQLTCRQAKAIFTLVEVPAIAPRLRPAIPDPIMRAAA